MSSSEQVRLFACDGERMVGIVHLPNEQPKQLAILVIVGGPQYRVGSHRQFTLMARAIATAGYPVLRFDYRGMGDSAGKFGGFEQVDADIRAGIDELYAISPQLEGVVLWGLCDAASACMMYGNRNDKRVKGMIVANPWVRTLAGEAQAYLRHYYLQRLLQKSFWLGLFGGKSNPFRSARDLFGAVKQAKQSGGKQDIASRESFIQRMLRGIQTADCPVLLLISEQDLTAREFTDHCRANEAWGRAMQSKSVSLEHLAGVDHTFSTEGGLTSVNRLCMNWIAGVAKSARLI